jgi:hypothetical protein
MEKVEREKYQHPVLDDASNVHGEGTGLANEQEDSL